MRTHYGRINLMGYCFMILVNILASTFTFHGKTTGDISDQYRTLFTPASYTFMIWGLIYLLLLGFVIYGLMPDQKKNGYIHAIGYKFLISCLLNGLWLVAWQYEKLWLSLAIMLLLLWTLIRIYKVLGDTCSVKKSDRRWINIPFSIYLSWICIATIANVAVVLQWTGWNGLGLSDTVWTCIVIVFALLLALYVSMTNNDLAFMLTAIWGLVGILVKHLGHNTPISITIIAGLVIMVVAVLTHLKEYLCLKN
ncbi:tryptophan-rich sensory protein [Vallitalea pronyensis]|uniref:Tryptophan-rich sensory protein n=1 Tax=Vallitalea pronyensis TaxID=1348613 RepID=A0A8J8MMR1_9FIRM|nr:hypothetical protein [Vallitalea pronyensis]QUI24321.1 tryptophan-rich sensory protein [Vallitalea pronyensis]